MARGFKPLDILTLGRWIDAELAANGSIFGIDSSLFVAPERVASLAVRREGRRLDTPLGVAAGPHTQLAENIVSAWLCGARFIELKTVQILDAIEVTKPCIAMADEGYNCEWSQELSLRHSYEQYVNAWVLIHLLHRVLFGEPTAAAERARGSRSGPPAPGVLFNMSVGYDLAGIRSEKITTYLSAMRNAQTAISERLERLSTVFPEAIGLEVPSQVAGSVTLSTMHGCVAEEIEQIARYLIEEVGLHTAVKLNPTLLGPEAIRETLNERLGYPVEVPRSAFAHDIAYADAVAMVRRLAAAADRAGVEFGLKLSNTLECRNDQGILPEREGRVYLSGRALYPLTVGLAARLASDLDAEVAISFAGGADALSFPGLVAAGVWPVTVCSDLLRPGGYGRLPQYLETLSRAMKESGAASVEELCDGGVRGRPLSPERLSTLAEEARSGGRFEKRLYLARSIKNARRLPELDCISPPCVWACPLGQRVPEYLRAAVGSDADEALRVIREDNPVAAICAVVCDHPCELACTRLSYDEPIAIRDLKRWAVDRGREPQTTPREPIALRVAVVGGGPAGLACAGDLARAGAQVTLYESARRAGGMAERVIPRFRISEGDVLRDTERVQAAGVRMVFGRSVSAGEALRMVGRECDFLFYAAGRPEDASMGIPGEDSPRVTGALAFLEEVKSSGRYRDLLPSRGGSPRVLVVGGGNSAVDAARSALRLVGARGQVELLYRRSVEQMPAEREELDAVLSEGVHLRTLALPVKIEDPAGPLAVTCVRTALGSRDSSGRPRPLPVEGSEFQLAADLVITAIGQRSGEESAALLGIPGASVEKAMRVREESPESGRVAVGAVDDRIFFGGDALRGPSSVVLAAADGKAAAQKILSAAGRAPRGAPREIVTEGSQAFGLREGWVERSSRLEPRLRPATAARARRTLGERDTGILSDRDAAAEASRCLDCDLRCDRCVEVCPNRANIAVHTTPRSYPLFRFSGTRGAVRLARHGTFSVRQERQVVNVVELCNECGNCTTFCPSSGEPFRVKPRFALTERTFQAEPSGYHLPIGTGARILHRTGGHVSTLEIDGERAVWSGNHVRLVFDSATMELLEARPSDGEPVNGTTEEAVRMAVLLDAVGNAPFPRPKRGRREANR